MEQVKITTERDPRWPSVVNRDAAASSSVEVEAIKTAENSNAPERMTRTLPEMPGRPTRYIRYV